MIILKLLGICFCGMLIGGTCGLLLEHSPGAIFRRPEDMLLPGLILTIVFTLIFTFRTPLGRIIFSVLDSGSGGTFVIFGGPVPVPISGAILCFMPLIFLGLAAAIIVMCLLDILVGLFKKR